MTSLVIVEDHKSMCEAIAAAFTATQRYQILGDVPSAGLAQLFCERLHPDIVLMDVCTEGGASGITATQQLKARFPQMKIIVMTAFDELSYLPRAKAAGADGFVYKSRSFQYFIEAADLVAAGHTSFPEPKTIPLPKGQVPLTDREMEVLRLICKHMTSREIAEQLFISENTVKFHKKNMLDKTGFKNSTDLAFYMITNGWINPLY